MGTAPSYLELEDSFTQRIKSKNLCVLATSKDDNVRAGTMGYASDALDIYCFSGVKTRKYTQIIANPNVAVVIGNLQIEGTASLGKHPFDEPEFLDIYREAYPEQFEIHSKRYFEASEDMRVIKITPAKITAFIPEDPAILQILDVENKKVHIINAHDPEDTPVYKG